MQHCTIYCRQLDRVRVVTTVQSVIQTFTTEQSDSSWTNLRVAGQEGAMEISTKQFVQAGDEFTRLRFSTYMFADSSSVNCLHDKEAFLSHLESTELIIGIVVDPAFSADNRYGEIVSRIAQMLDGLIFNGEAYLTPGGEQVAVVSPRPGQKP